MTTLIIADKPRYVLHGGELRLAHCTLQKPLSRTKFRQLAPLHPNRNYLAPATHKTGSQTTYSRKELARAKRKAHRPRVSAVNVFGIVVKPRLIEPERLGL